MYFNGATLNVGSKLEDEQKIVHDVCLVHSLHRVRQKKLTRKSREAIIPRKRMKTKEKKVMTQVRQKPKQKYLLNVLYIKFFGDDKSEK